MAEQSGNSGTDSTPVDASIESASISPDLESSVQDKLSETFGGVDKDALDKEAPADQDGGGRDAADDGERTTVVRQHRRRVRSRNRSEDADQGWGEDPQDPIHDEGKPQGKKAQGSQPGDEPGEAAGEADQGGQDPAPTPADPDGIPPHLIDAARRRGWTDDRIQRLVQADPELAQETFEQLHQDANELSRRYAEIGRAMQGNPQQQTGQPAPQPYGQPPAQGQTPAPGSQFQQPQWPQGQVPGQQQVPPQQPQQGQPQGGALLPEFEFPKEVLEGLDDEFKSGVLDRVQNHMNQVNQVINNVVARHEQFIQERQNEMLYQQVDQFFDSRKGYEKIYGSGKQRTDLTQEELNQRMRVLQEADAIHAGARIQGRNLTVHEALEMAHNLVSSQHQRETARRDIQGQLQKRERQATVRPTHRSGPAENSNDPLARAQQTAARKLRELNGASR